MDSPASADGLIRSRDGIVGPWQPLPAGSTPVHLGFDNPANLDRWELPVRESVIDFELHSRIGFSANTTGISASIWHLQLMAGSPPTATYQPLVTLVRPSEAVFREQLALVFNYADLRGDRASEILAQLGGGGAFLASLTYLHPDRTPWTWQLIASTIRLAKCVEMRLKHALACRRPHEYSPQIQPMIQTPSHGSLPSGHSTETFASALVLWNLLKAAGIKPYGEPSWGEELMRLAARVAINRTVAGVHFPVDSAAGCVLGLTLGTYMTLRCMGAGTYTGWQFDGNAYPVPSSGNPPPDDGDFYWHALYNVTSAAQTPTTYATKLSSSGLPADQSPILNRLWTKALGEWT
jgi:membrane-associated phospholipid phosphatase